MTTLVDTSALAKLLVEEDESGALRAFLLARAAAGERFYISTLAITELRRLAIRGGIDSAFADDVLARFSVIRLSESVLQLAGRLPARQLGTLDAIHLASALTIESTSLVTYDRRQADAAHREGMRVDAPGP